MYKFGQSNFSIVQGAQRPRADFADNYPGGTTYLTDRQLNEPSLNKSIGVGTNGRVLISINTRTTDQRLINSAQLAFIDNSQFDNPRLMSLQTVNRLLITEGTPQFITSSGKFSQEPGPMYHKKNVLERFKLMGVVVTKERHGDPAMPMLRGSRGVTLVTWGDAFVLNYWSNKKNVLRPYDSCFLVLRRVKYNKGTYTFQDDLSVARTEIPTPMGVPIDENRWYWQWVPWSCRDNAMDPAQLVNEWDGNYELGSYLRVGKVHEYGDIGNHSMYGNRDETAVARDVAHLHMNGRARPFQFYLHLDDDTKLI